MTNTVDMESELEHVEWSDGNTGIKWKMESHITKRDDPKHTIESTEN